MCAASLSHTPATLECPVMSLSSCCRGGEALIIIAFYCLTLRLCLRFITDPYKTRSLHDFIILVNINTSSELSDSANQRLGFQPLTNENRLPVALTHILCYTHFLPVSDPTQDCQLCQSILGKLTGCRQNLLIIHY